MTLLSFCCRSTYKYLYFQELVKSLEGETGSLLPLECDLRQEEQILAMFTQIRQVYGGVDVCVNCAGLGKIATLLDGETDKWREILDVSGGLCLVYK